MDDDNVFRRIARFEDGVGSESQPWLGGVAGLVLGVVLIVVAVAATILLWGVGFGSGSSFVTKVCGAIWLITVAAVAAYWRRHRLAAHFQAAHGRLGSGESSERQRGLTDLMINARRSWAEHGRIARALTEYLRRPPEPLPEERGRRQLAFTMLADQTLVMSAKKRLDLTGAVLVGIRGVDAELPGACLRGADLTGAKLARANLAGADLQDARLDGADFMGARLEDTILAGRDAVRGRPTGMRS